jgi:uncharacterized protein YdaU (DUF1376 family)
MHYYKRNIGDYAKKTGRLTMLQHGAYTLLIDSCYDRETFPTLDEAIEWTWASSTEEIEAVTFVIKKFFVLQDGVYVQNRIREELENYHNNSETNKRIALEREAKRRENRTKREQFVNEAPPNQEPLTINQEPNISICPPSGELEDKSGLTKVWHEKVVDLYHSHLPTLRRVEVWNETRKGYLRQRWREVFQELCREKKDVTDDDVLAWWSDFFQHIGQSKFLTGRVNDKSGRAFTADLEWILKPSNFAKIIEGKYHGI